MRRRLVGLVLLIALLSPAAAAADWLITPFAGVRFGTDTTYLDPERGTEKRKFAWGASVALLTTGVLGLEADFSYIPGFFEGQAAGSLVGQSRAISLMGNVIVAAPLAATRGGLRPYLVGGLGFLHVNAEDPARLLYSAHANVLGLNIGGGAIGPLTSRTSVRFELRQFRSLGKDDDVPVLNAAEGFKLSFWRATAGITIHLQ